LAPSSAGAAEASATLVLGAGSAPGAEIPGPGGDDALPVLVLAVSAPETWRGHDAGATGHAKLRVNAQASIEAGRRACVAKRRHNQCAAAWKDTQRGGLAATQTCRDHPVNLYRVSLPECDSPARAPFLTGWQQRDMRLHGES
jgi:hypothetical protein